MSRLQVHYVSVDSFLQNFGPYYWLIFPFAPLIGNVHDSIILQSITRPCVEDMIDSHLT